jgi:hypothetical protein
LRERPWPRPFPHCGDKGGARHSVRAGVRIRRNQISRIEALNRSADWQSAVSRIGNPHCSRRFMRQADCQSAIQQVANLRYGRFRGRGKGALTPGKQRCDVMGRAFSPWHNALGREPGPPAQAGMNRAFGPEPERQGRVLKSVWGTAPGNASKSKARAKDAPGGWIFEGCWLGYLRASPRAAEFRASRGLGACARLNCESYINYRLSLKNT